MKRILPFAPTRTHQRKSTQILLNQGALALYSKLYHNLKKKAIEDLPTPLTEKAPMPKGKDAFCSLLQEKGRGYKQK
jgi:hypothetical protein